MTKSPFLLIKNFISPLECENIISSFNGHFPDFDKNDKDIKTILKNPLYQKRIWERLSDYFDYIENYYSVEVDTLSPVNIEWYPERCIQEDLRCENSQYIAKSWRIFNDYDFVVLIFLKDLNESTNFDRDFECYGGKLELPNHNFGINPERGTAIIFPANQYFLNRTLSPKFGDMFQIRLHISCEKRFKYSPSDYQGNYSIWFNNLT